jgi:hypothetical protein
VVANFKVPLKFLEPRDYYDFWAKLNFGAFVIMVFGVNYFYTLFLIT